MLIGLVIAVLLVAAVGTSVFLTQDDEPTPENIGTAVGAYLADNPEFSKSTYCLQDFPYDKSPVSVSGYDNHTKRWLDSLAAAGLYSPGEAVSSGGWMSFTNYVYTKTALGELEMQAGTLCLATGLKVKHVGEVIRETSASPETVVAQVSLDLNGAKAWASESVRRAAIDDDALNLTFRFALKDRHWIVQQGGKSVGAIRRAPDKEAKAVTPSAVGSFFSGLFSFGASNPILGKWQMQEFGVTFAAFTIEFRESEAELFGETVPVRYEISGNEVRVHMSDSKKQTLIVTAVDAETIHISEGRARQVLKRVR